MIRRSTFSDVLFKVSYGVDKFHFQGENFKELTETSFRKFFL